MLEWWVTPDGAQVLGLDDAIAGLDYGALRQHFAHEMLALLALSDERAAANEG